MALLFMEGFANSSNDISQKWNAGSTVNSIGTSGPHATGGTWALIYGNSPRKTVTASAKIIAGCANLYNSGNVNEISFLGDAGATQHISITRNASGYIEIRRGAYTGTLLATSATTITTGVWAYLEISVTISDTIGEVHVRLNGSNTDFVSYTGDTKNGGTSTNIDTFGVWAGGSGNLYISDVYICNDLGSANNTFLGEVAVRTLSPSGNGNSSQLVGSDANSTDNYLLVDEKPFSGADYVGSPTLNNKDTYTLQDLPAGATTVYGIQVNANMVKSDVSSGQARTVIRSGGTDYGGTTQVLSTSAITYMELYEQNPNTSAAWTSANVNALEAGMEVM